MRPEIYDCVIIYQTFLIFGYHYHLAVRYNTVKARDSRLETVKAASRKVALRVDRRLEVAALTPMDAEMTFSDIRLCWVDEPKSVIDSLLADN